MSGSGFVTVTLPFSASGPVFFSTHVTVRDAGCPRGTLPSATVDWLSQTHGARPVPSRTNCVFALQLPTTSRIAVRRPVPFGSNASSSDNVRPVSRRIGNTVGEMTRKSAAFAPAMLMRWIVTGNDPRFCTIDVRDTGSDCPCGVLLKTTFG